MAMLNKFKKKHIIKIPKNIKVLYCDEKNIVTFIGQSLTKSLKLILILRQVQLWLQMFLHRVPLGKNSKV